MNLKIILFVLALLNHTESALKLSPFILKDCNSYKDDGEPICNLLGSWSVNRDVSLIKTNYQRYETVTQEGEFFGYIELDEDSDVITSRGRIFLVNYYLNVNGEAIPKMLIRELNKYLIIDESFEAIQTYGDKFYGLTKDGQFLSLAVDRFADDIDPFCLEYLLYYWEYDDWGCDCKDCRLIIVYDNDLEESFVWKIPHVFDGNRFYFTSYWYADLRNFYFEENYGVAVSAYYYDDDEYWDLNYMPRAWQVYKLKKSEDKYFQISENEEILEYTVYDINKHYFRNLQTEKGKKVFEDDDYYSIYSLSCEKRWDYLEEYGNSKCWFLSEILPVDQKGDRILFIMQSYWADVFVEEYKYYSMVLWIEGGTLIDENRYADASNYIINLHEDSVSLMVYSAETMGSDPKAASKSRNPLSYIRVSYFESYVFQYDFKYYFPKGMYGVVFNIRDYVSDGISFGVTLDGYQVGDYKYMLTIGSDSNNSELMILVIGIILTFFSITIIFVSIKTEFARKSLLKQMPPVLIGMFKFNISEEELKDFIDEDFLREEFDDIAPMN